MAAVSVLQEIRISPSPSLPSQPPQALSFLDTMWLQHSKPVERLFFYEFPHPTSRFIEQHLPIFTKSLSLTLHHFYPLAGSILPSPDSDDQFEIVYKEGDSVPLTVAEFSDDDFGNISGHHARSFRKLHLLVPKLASSSYGGIFLPHSIQITFFPNQGLCIGFAINHAVCDGSGLMQFTRSWAAACRSTEHALVDIRPPFLDRSVMIDTHGIQRKIFEAMRQFKEILKKEDEMPFSNPNSVSATFTLNKDHILRLKKRVRRKEVEERKPSYHISAFVVTCAYVWRCLVKARGYDGDIKQCLGSPVDWRSRMRPAPIPSNYFGNCLGTFLTELKAAEVVGKDGIERAAMEIGKSIDGLQGTDLGEILEAAIDKNLEMAGSRMLSISGSPKFRVYEVDFGWGRPVKVDITSIVETGAMSLAESRDEEGGMEIGLILSEEEMNKFRNNFATGLLNLLVRVVGYFQTVVEIYSKSDFAVDFLVSIHFLIQCC